MRETRGMEPLQPQDMTMKHSVAVPKSRTVRDILFSIMDKSNAINGLTVATKSRLFVSDLDLDGLPLKGGTFEPSIYEMLVEIENTLRDAVDMAQENLDRP